MRWPSAIAALFAGAVALPTGDEGEHKRALARALTADGPPAEERVVFLHPENSGGTSFVEWVRSVSELCERGDLTPQSPQTGVLSHATHNFLAERAV